MAMEKILIVDDEPNICEVLRTILVKEGYSRFRISDFLRQSGVPQLGETFQDHSCDDRRRLHSLEPSEAAVRILAGDYFLKDVSI